MYYPWNINGVKANVTEECLYINIGTYLYKKEGCKIRKGGFFEHNKYLFRKKIMEHSSYIRFQGALTLYRTRI